MLTNNGVKTFVCTQGIPSILPGAGNVPPNVITEALKNAEKKVEVEGKKPEVIDAAKVNTETILKGLLTSLDWTATIEWK
jgi:hypothetical protein